VSPGPSSLIGLVWLSNRQNSANSTVLLMMVSAVTVGIPAEFQPATPEPWTTTSLGANDSVVTGHAWAHSIPRSSTWDTGGNDGFTAWQIRNQNDEWRIRTLDRRLRLLAVLWRYSGQIALMLYTDSMGEIYFGKRKKFLFGRKVVRLKPDQPDRRLRPCDNFGKCGPISIILSLLDS